MQVKYNSTHARDDVTEYDSKVELGVMAAFLLGFEELGTDDVPETVADKKRAGHYGFFSSSGYVLHADGNG